MDDPSYQRWMAGGAEGSMASQGEDLFQKFACNTCHTNNASGRGPVLAGLFGKQVVLNDGRTVIADENYIRESILNPQAKIVQGYGPIMPTFQGQVNEEDLLKLLVYVRSLAAHPALTPAIEPRSGGQAPPPVPR